MDQPDDPDLDALGDLPDLDLPDPEPDPVDSPLDPYPTDPGPLDLGELPDLPDHRPEGRGPESQPDRDDRRGDERDPRPDDRGGPGSQEPPVALDLDEPITPAHTEPAASGAVDLSLDETATVPADTVDAPHQDAPPDEDPEAGSDDLVDLPLHADALTPLDVPAGNAALADELVAAGLLAIGATTAVLRRTRRSSPPDLVAHLDELGIDARVDHLDLTGIEELLAAGHTVLLSTDGSAGVDADAVVQVRSVDRADGTLQVLDGRGRRSTVGLDRFELAWADSANQVVVASGAGGGVALVPVVLGVGDLAPMR